MFINFCFYQSIFLILLLLVKKIKNNETVSHNAHDLVILQRTGENLNVAFTFINS